MCLQLVLVGHKVVSGSSLHGLVDGCRDALVSLMNVEEVACVGFVVGEDVFPLAGCSTKATMTGFDEQRREIVILAKQGLQHAHADVLS